MQKIPDDALDGWLKPDVGLPYGIVCALTELRERRAADQRSVTVPILPVNEDAERMADKLLSDARGATRKIGAAALTAEEVEAIGAMRDAMSFAGIHPRIVPLVNSALDKIIGQGGER